MAFLYLSIGGNPDFGGYLSVDGGRSILMKDDMVYEIEDGLHAYTIHSTSDAQRRSGRVQGTINNLTGSGGFFDTVNRVQAMNAIGDEWNFQARAVGDEVLVIEIVTKGNNIITTPEYRVTEFEEETIQSWKEYFAEEHAKEAEKERKRQEERAKPRRSKPKIIVGSILTGLGALGSLIGISTMAGGEGDPSGFVPMAVFLVVGLILLLTGLKKKVRK